MIKEPMPLLSVITVTFNNAHGLRRTMESVMSQDFPGIEVIVIDGGSTDGTAEVIREFSARLKFWVSEPDRGIYDAMNKGIGQASGEWIIFMNAGDIFHDRRVISAVFRHEMQDAGVVYGDSIAEYPGFRTFRKALPIEEIRKGMVCCHQSMFFRTSLMKGNMYRTDLAFSGDYELVLRLFTNSVSFKYLPVTCAVFDTRGTSNIHMVKSARANLEILRSIGPVTRPEESFHRRYIRKALISEWMYRLLPGFLIRPVLRRRYRDQIIPFQGGNPGKKKRDGFSKAIRIALFPLTLIFRLVQDRMDFLRDYRLKLIIARVLRIFRLISGTTGKVQFPDTVFPPSGTAGTLKITIVDHSYHFKTASNSFFIDLLRQAGTVRMIWDSRWNGGPTIPPGRIDEDHPDLVVLWQIMIYHDPEALKKLRCKNVVIVPMYDDIHGDPDRLFLRYRDFPFVSFSSHLHRRLTGLSIRSEYYQFFPDAARLPERKHSPGGLRGFFWQRTNDITWEHIRKLIEGTAFESFHLHLALDPLWYREVLPTEEEMREYHITISRWFGNRDDFFTVFSQAGVFFSPRLYEGIGMPVLEAMAMGMTVVAPDHPTMNEYIRNGETGLLYDPGNPVPLDFSNASQIGAQAREDSLKGRENWQGDSGKLISYLVNRK